MTTPTEHWAQLSGADLVAELRRRVGGATSPITVHPAALLRAAEAIEAHAQETERANRIIEMHLGTIERRDRKIEAQAERINELERWFSMTDPWRQ